MDTKCHVTCPVLSSDLLRLSISRALLVADEADKAFVLSNQAFVPSREVMEEAGHLGNLPLLLATHVLFPYLSAYQETCLTPSIL